MIGLLYVSIDFCGCLLQAGNQYQTNPIPTPTRQLLGKLYTVLSVVPMVDIHLLMTAMLKTTAVRINGVAIHSAYGFSKRCSTGGSNKVALLVD